jgi:hypothetical protein
MRASEKGLGLHALSLTVLFIYILLEISFNARVASIAGFSSLNTDGLRSLELLGRSVSGLGAALLLVDTFLSRVRVRGAVVRSVLATVVAVTSFSGMFFGQRILVDSLIDASSPGLRYQAVRAQALRGAIAEGVVELEEGAQTLIQARNADAKIFMTLFPAASTMNTSLKQQIDDQLEDIASVYEARLAARIFEAGYPRYDTTRDSIIDDLYPRYLQASTEYLQERKLVTKNARKISRAIKPKVMEAWEDYEDLRRESADERANSSRGKEAKKAYQVALEMDAKCRRISSSRESERKSCFLGSGKTLRNKLAAAGFREEEMRSAQWWLEQKSYGGFFSALNVDGVRLLLMQPGEFIQASGGYSPDIQAYSAFYSHRETANQVRDALTKEGVAPAENWQTTEPKNIVADMERYLAQSLGTGWREGLAKAGVAGDIDPDLDFDEFVVAAGIREKLRKKMNLGAGETVSLRLNKRDFYRQIAEPEAGRRAAEINRIMRAAPAKFSDGKVYESEGKQAVRATYIPPIVMILSLTMVMISSLKIFAGIVPSKRIGKLGKVMVAAAACWAVLAVPFYFRPANNPIDQAMDLDSGYSESVHPLIVSAVRWLVHTQPLIFPLGQAVDTSLRIGGGFKQHLEPHALLIDSRVDI